LAADSFNYPAYQRHLITAKREINESIGRHIHGRRVFQPKGLPPKVNKTKKEIKLSIFSFIFIKRLARFNYLLKIMSMQMCFLNN
jgi:hypothetical protein